MPSSLLTPRRSLLIIAVLLLVNVLLPTKYGVLAGTPPKAVLDFATSPFRAPLHSLGNALRGGPGSALMRGGQALTDDEIQTEVGRALALIRQLEDRLREANAQIEQLTQAREALSLTGISLVEARVTGYDTGGGVNPTLTLDRGRTKGIIDNLTVVSGFNLVGRVNKAYAGTSDVTLITRPETKLQVRIVPPQSDAPRSVDQLIELSDSGKYFWVRLTHNDVVEVGDLAHLSDDRWPDEARGFVVGAVTRVDPDPRDPLNFKRAIIEPMRPLENLTRATVLVPVE